MSGFASKPFGEKAGFFRPCRWEEGRPESFSAVNRTRDKHSIPLRILEASLLESCIFSAPLLTHSSFVLSLWHSLASGEELEPANWPKPSWGCGFKGYRAAKCRYSQLEKVWDRGHTREKHSTAYLFAGWQDIKARKLKSPPFKVTLHGAILSKALREKKQFQHGVSMERLQEDYLKRYKKAMLWNVVLYSNTSMIGMVSSLTVYFYKEVWATLGFISYKSMKGFRTCWVFEA